MTTIRIIKSIWNYDGKERGGSDLTSKWLLVNCQSVPVFEKEDGLFSERYSRLISMPYGRKLLMTLEFWSR